MSYKRGPWIVVGTKEVYKNPWMTVREDKVIRPDQKSGIFGIVTLKPGVSILPLDDQGNVFLVEQYRYMMGRKTLEAVSGGIDGKESPLQAAKRELMEEVGIKAKEWIDLGTVDPFTTVVKVTPHIFFAKGLTISKPNQEEVEKTKVIKTTLKQAIDWVQKGLITNALTIILIFKAKDQILKNSSKIIPGN